MHYGTNQGLLDRIHRGYNIALMTKPESLGQQMYAVPSATDPSKVYFVSLMPDKCTCPDFEYRVSKGELGINGICKHIAAVRLSQPLREQPEEKLWDVEFHTKVYAPDRATAQLKGLALINQNPQMGRAVESK
jgi:hypothetical protein